MLLVLLFLFRLWNEKQRSQWTDADDLVILKRFAIVVVCVAVFVAVLR